MLHIGCHLSVAGGYAAMAKDALSIEADTFAFFTRNPRGGKAKPLEKNDVREFLDILDEHRFAKLVAHAPYTLNPCSKDERVREFAMTAMREDLERMEATPFNFYNFHPGSHVGQGIEAGIHMIAGQLNQLLTKDQTTVVLLETMSGKGSEVGGRFEEIAEIIRLVDRKDRIGVCMDSCHVSDAGYDIIHDLDGVLQEFDALVGLEYLHAFHINDSKNPPGSRKDRHARIGEGTLGMETFAALVTHPYLKDLPFILETPQEDLEGYHKEIKLLRELAEAGS